MGRGGSHRAGLAGRIGAMAAAVMLVLSGASHELFNDGDCCPDQAVQVETVAAPAAESAQAPAKGERAPVRIQACSGHCAAHSTTAPPAFIEAAAPRVERQPWRFAAAVAAREHQPEAARRPPRA